MVFYWKPQEKKKEFWDLSILETKKCQESNDILLLRYPSSSSEWYHKIWGLMLGASVPCDSSFNIICKMGIMLEIITPY